MLHTHPNDPDTPEPPRAVTVGIAISCAITCEPGTELLTLEVCPWGTARGDDADTGALEYLGADLSGLSGSVCIDGVSRPLVLEDGCLVAELEVD